MLEFAPIYIYLYNLKYNKTFSTLCASVLKFRVFSFKKSTFLYTFSLKMTGEFFRKNRI